ncbi:MAG: proteasome-activating nucleotidase [Methermicoccaceae archaeon]
MADSEDINTRQPQANGKSTKAGREVVGEDIEDYSRYLMEKLKQLESKNDTLRNLNYQMETEIQMAERIKLKQEQEIKRLKKELEKLKTPPLLVGTVNDIIDEDNAVVKISNGNSFLVALGEELEEVEVGSLVVMNQQTLAVVDTLPSTYSTIIKHTELIEDTCVDFSQIGGLKEQIRELRETVELPLTQPELFERVGIEPPQGVLLYGPPGTGKTLLAKAVAHSTNAKFVRIVGSELVQKYIGEGARLVRELFQLARENAPSIVFIDELDAVGAKRYESTTGDREVHRTLMQLLAELDGFEPRENVSVIAATNRPDILDPALLRPGRFDRMIEVPLPDEDAREEILRVHTASMNVAQGVDFRRVSKLTLGGNGADLRMIAIEAGMFAIRDARDTVVEKDFEMAIEKVKSSSSGVCYPEGMFA